MKIFCKKERTTQRKEGKEGKKKEERKIEKKRK